MGRAGHADDLLRDVVKLPRFGCQGLVPDDVRIREYVDGALARQVVPAVQVADRWDAELAGSEDVVGLDWILGPNRGRDENNVRIDLLEQRDDGLARRAVALVAAPGS